MDLPTLSVHLLGGFRIYRGETALSDRFKPRLQALIAYLLLHQESTLSRQQVAFHFWPDSTEAQARANVRKSVYRLRQIFPQVDDYLALEGATLSRRAGAPLWLDVAEFETALETAAEADPSQKASLLQAAISLYKGDLLPDLYDDWVLPGRERLRRRYLRALNAVARIHEEQRDYASAITIVRQLLREDPLVEEGYRHLMRLQALSGDVAGALRTYHRCARQLGQELGVEPGQATQEAYHRLLHRRERPQPVAERRTRRQFPLIGREDAWERLLGAWRRVAAGGPQVVVISGEAGVGKTRLAEELLRWTDRQGIVTLSAACFASETPLPLQAIGDWLRSPAVESALPGLAPRWRSELARVLPELLAADPALETPRPMTESWQQHHFFMALAEAVTAAGEPLLLFLDDLHWADAETLDWLQFLAQQKGDHRFLLVGAVRTEEMARDHPLLSWQEALARLLRVRAIALERLGAPDTAALAASVLGHSLPEESAASLHRETEGNPLFAVEMVRAGLSSEEAPLPEKVRSVIEIRLSRLSPPAQELAALAAVVGRRFAVPLLQAASPQSEMELLDSLDELWQRQIIREQGEDAYDFSHDKIRQVALDRLSGIRRRWWHGRVARALEQIVPGDPATLHGQIAGHHEAAGDIEKAVAAYHRAGEEARAIYAMDEAMTMYRKALSLIEGLPGEQATPAKAQRAQILKELGQVLVLTGKKEEARSVFTDALALGTARPALESDLYRRLGATYVSEMRFEEARTAYHRAAAALPPPETLASGNQQTCWVELQLSRLGLAYSLGDITTMEKLIRDVTPIVERQATPAQRARFLHALTLIAVRKARYAPPLEDAYSYAEQAHAASRESGNQMLIVGEWFSLGFISLWQGNDEAAEEYLKRTLVLAEQIGYENQRLLCLTYLTVLYRRRGADRVAEAYAEQCLCLAQAGKWLTYVAAAQANLAWIAWRAGRLAEAWQLGLDALEQWRGGAYPFQWLALWPLIAVGLEQGEAEQALDFAGALLGPVQQSLPDAVTATLDAALQTPDAAEAVPLLRQAVRLAREHRLL